MPVTTDYGSSWPLLICQGMSASGKGDSNAERPLQDAKPTFGLQPSRARYGRFLDVPACASPIVRYGWKADLGLCT
jgi:hypothetical protein